jgi:hypothetical protein
VGKLHSRDLPSKGVVSDTASSSSEAMDVSPLICSDDANGASTDRDAADCRGSPSVICCWEVEVDMCKFEDDDELLDKSAGDAV